MTFFLKMHAFFSHLPCLDLTHMDFYHTACEMCGLVMIKACSSLVDRLVCLPNLSQSHRSRNGHRTLTVMLSNILLGLSCC